MGFFKAALKRPLVSIFGACAICSVLSTQLAEPLAVQDLDDYAADNGIPHQVFEGIPYQDNIKVYRNNPAGFFYDAGVSSYRTTKYMSHQLFEDEDSNFARGAVSVPIIALMYPVTVVNQVIGNIFGGDLNAYALPGYTESGTAYINPPGDMTVKEFIHQFTNIPEEHISDIEDEVAPLIPIMAHEAKHSELILSKTAKERGLNSFVLGGEVEADNHYMSVHDDVFPNSDMDKIFFYTRAVSLFSRESIFDAGHATSLNVDAFLKGEDQPTREQAYYNYGHMNELIKKRLIDFDSEDEGEYYQAVYNAVKDILENEETVTPLMRRTGELYLEGVEYIADKSPLFKAPKPQLKTQASFGAAMPSMS